MQVKLKDQDTGEEFNFECNKTLEGSDNNPSGKLELPAIRPDIEPLTGEKTSFYVSVKLYQLQGNTMPSTISKCWYW